MQTNNQTMIDFSSGNYDFFLQKKLFSTFFRSNKIIHEGDLLRTNRLQNMRELISDDKIQNLTSNFMFRTNFKNQLRILCLR